MPHPASTPTGTVVLAHGSTSPAQRDVVTALAARAQAADARASTTALTGPWRAAFLDHDRPTLHEAASELIATGCSRLVVVPALLSHAFHSQVDVPRVVETIDPSVQVSVAAPIGPDALLMNIVERRVAEWEGSRAGQATDAQGVCVVVAAAGTSDIDARQDFVRMVAALPHYDDAQSDSATSNVRHEFVAAFIAGGDPDVTTAIAHAASNGRTPVLAPFLLARGALSDRATRQAMAAGTVSVLEPLGAADEVVAILLARRDACATV